MTDAPSLTFAFGHNTVTFSTPNRALCDLMAFVFHAFRGTDAPPVAALRDVPDPAQEAEYVARMDGDEWTFASFGRALLALEDRLAYRLLADSGHLLLHAGAVTDGERIVLIPGPSGAGKSSVTLEYVRRGFRFIADEYVALDVAGACLHPFPRSAVLKTAARDWPAEECLVLESDVGARSFVLPTHRVALDPLPIGDLSIVFPRHALGSQTRVQALDAAQACARLLPNTFNFEDEEDRLWPTLSGLAVRATAFAVDFGDASDVPGAVPAFPASD